MAGSDRDSRFCLEEAAYLAFRLKEVHKAAVLRLLEISVPNETLVRTLAWALDASRPWRYSVVAVSPEAAQLLADTIHGPFRALCWMAGEPISSDLLSTAQASGVVVIADSGQSGLEAAGSHLLLGMNQATIELPALDNQPRRLTLSPIASIVQALLTGPSDGAWRRIRPPKGFLALAEDCSARQARDLLARGLISLVSEGPIPGQIVIADDFFPKTSSLGRWIERKKTARFLNEGEDLRMSIPKSDIVYPQEISGADPVSDGTIEIVCPFNVPPGGRTKDELDRGLRQIKVNSVRDISRGFDIRLEGNVKGVGGETVHLSIPVEDEDTFTPDGMTRRDPTLFGWYVRYRTYEECQRYLSERGRGRLTPEEIAKLQSMLRFLEEAEKNHE
ncbi:MAG TPA: hypothetical protein VGV60_01950 [Candidatus Polarisedimenticolia bacterium]|nr:hypothetical protein [Candidatus Polarisedimenticolia bacterium]